MYKAVLLFILSLLSTSTETTTTPNHDSETKELREWVYWDAFSNTFNDTADYWKAESAALEAEMIAENRTGVEKFLEEVKKKETPKAEQNLK